MGIFRDVTLVWKGEAFVIPATQVLGAIAIVEEQITFMELIVSMQKGKPPLVQIARAYGGVLRYAGAKVTDEETYAGIFDPVRHKKIMAAVNMLLVMMVPTDALAGDAKSLAGEAPAPGNRKAASAARPSRRSSRRRLAAAG